MKFLLTHTMPSTDHVIEINSLDELMKIAVKADEDNHETIIRKTWSSEKHHGVLWAIEIYDGYRE